MRTYNLFLESENNPLSRGSDKLSQLQAVNDARVAKKISVVHYSWNEKTECVDFKGNVTINTNEVFNLQDLGFRFGKIISGDFDCEGIEQKNLEGSPSSCRNFDVSHSELTSLEGGPDLVENFNATNCLIKGLKGSPSFVMGDFALSRNMIMDLREGPLIVTGNISLSVGNDDKDYNLVKSFKQMHKDIVEEFGNINKEISIKNIEEAVQNNEYVAKLLIKDLNYINFLRTFEPSELAEAFLKSNLNPAFLYKLREKLPQVWEEIIKIKGNNSGYGALADLGEFGF